MTDLDKILAEVTNELDRAAKKFPTWPNDPLHALAVLGEEFGELTKELLDLSYAHEGSSLSKARAEAIQTAAMAVRVLISIDQHQYVFIPSMQHYQYITGECD